MSEWKPIDTAPKNARILLGYSEAYFTGITSICGKWDDDKHANKPKPHWTNDMNRLMGVVATRAYQPIAWMPLPSPPCSQDCNP